MAGNPLRVGRMPRWQRRTTYAVLAACAGSGIVWFVLLDVVHAAQATARVWWIVHGVTAFVATMAIGGAIAQHVVVNWRHARGRRTGAVNLAMLVGLVGTALYLMYGNEPGHDALHWIHAIGGIAAVAVFAWHVIHGRTRVARRT